MLAVCANCQKQFVNVVMRESSFDKQLKMFQLHHMEQLCGMLRYNHFANFWYPTVQYTPKHSNCVQTFVELTNLSNSDKNLSKCGYDLTF